MFFYFFIDFFFFFIFFLFYVCFFFFFQAEDGIRDTSVTGVQTCALPILQHHSVFQEPAEVSHQPAAPNQSQSRVRPRLLAARVAGALIDAGSSKRLSRRDRKSVV